MGKADEYFSLNDSNPELFSELASQGVPFRFIGTLLSARKLPVARQVLTWWTLID